MRKIPIPESAAFYLAWDLRLAAKEAVERTTPWTQPTGGVYQPRPRRMHASEAWPLPTGWTWSPQG